MRKIAKTIEDFKIIKGECFDYAESVDDMDESVSYKIELDHCHNWEQLVRSGVFRDAIGKVMKNTDTEVVVDEEY